MHAHDGGRRHLAVRYLLCLFALLSALALVGGAGTSTASAQSICEEVGGVLCLPTGNDYTIDRSWDCGEITTPRCYAVGTKNNEAALLHTWSWASASNSSAGTTTVCASVESHTSCGTNLARICYYFECQDIDTWLIRTWVSNGGGGSYRVSGHAKA